jgi:histidyl-tRNA synthetase
MKPSIPKGTRDFGPAEMNRRNYIFDTIRSVFKLYGYQPIETPSMENLSTLLGKYGEEGDKLLFRILNSGDYLKDVPDQLLQQKAPNAVSPHIAEKGLRYDLTVPFARFVVQYRNELVFPFRRYQIQPVWRADRPQKGRYREFYQCDVDVVGSDSLLNEAELIQIIDDVFQRLNLKVIIKINNRKVLAGIAEFIGHPDKITDITVAIDKLDKIGGEKVNEELTEKGIPSEAVEKLQPVIHLSGTTEEKIAVLRTVLQHSDIAQKGLDELQTVFDYIHSMGIQAVVELDLTLARGLNYYTGAIFEVKSAEVSMGSICGGGRYDNLTGIFGLPDVSGVGVSFGADRIYDVLEQSGGFPADTTVGTSLLFVNFGPAEEKYCLPLLTKLRTAGISAEMYPEQAKMKKQMGYADSRKIPYVVLVGEEEMQSGILTLKNMLEGSQKKVSIEDLITQLKIYPELAEGS